MGFCPVRVILVEENGKILVVLFELPSLLKDPRATLYCKNSKLK